MAEDFKKQRDLRQEITDRMVQSLESGRIPWERPWERLEHGLPRNMVTGKTYNGGNRLLLQLAQMDHEYADPRFGTIKQINELGGRVKQGEKGHPIEVWKDQPFWARRDVEISLNNMRVKVFKEAGGIAHVGKFADKEPTIAVNTSDLTVRHNGTELGWSAAHKQLDSVACRVYTVFNVEQCTGLKIEPLKAPENEAVKIPPVERAEQLMAAMQKDGLRFGTHPDRAFYSPALDEVRLPPRESFKSVEGYYGTALHEIGHATGAAHRLNREGITGNHRFGSEGYAKEELRAELFSAFIGAETGIPHDEDQHKAYIQSWIKALKRDKNEIFRAAAEASKAVDYVLAKEQELEIGRIAEKQAEKMIISEPDPSVGPTESIGFFCAKVSDGQDFLDELKENINQARAAGYLVRVEKDVKLPTAEYDRFTNDFFEDQPWLAGEGGTNQDGALCVIRVTAKDRQTLYVDPQGYNYARYVGVSERDLHRMLDRGSLIVPANEVAPAPDRDVAVLFDQIRDGEDLRDAIASEYESGDVPDDKVRVVHTAKLHTAEYDRALKDLSAIEAIVLNASSRSPLGKDADGADRVVKIAAPNRQALFVDADGRVGIPKRDIARVIYKESFIAPTPKEQEQGQEKMPAPAAERAAQQERPSRPRHWHRQSVGLER